MTLRIRPIQLVALLLTAGLISACAPPLEIRQSHEPYAIALMGDASVLNQFTASMSPAMSTYMAGSGFRALFDVTKSASELSVLGQPFRASQAIRWVAYTPGSATALGALSAAAAPDDNGAVWDKAYQAAEELQTQIEQASVQAYGVADAVRLVEVEPNVAHYDPLVESYEGEGQPPSNKRVKLAAAADETQRIFSIVEESSPAWPTASPGWHLGAEYSQLSDAQKALTSKNPADERIHIAHLDTGFYSKDALLLVNRDEQTTWPYGHFDVQASRNFYRANDPSCATDSSLSSEQIRHGDCPGHGSRTLSVLAGGDLRIAATEEHEAFEGPLGGNPYAGVAEFRIGKSFLHVFPTEMASAIEYASRNGFDVISISAGGFPSAVQRDAVNVAYERGTAVFSASGDFVKLPFGLSFFGIRQTPSTVAFPARFNRVMAVAGTTGDFASYGDDPYSSWLGLLKHPFSFSTWHDWMVRGNYGPYEVMEGAQAVSAYAPNITRSNSTVVANGELGYDVGLNGEGTSNATPQVAAAASIWLETQRVNIEAQPGAWTSWQKAEAVYQAVSVCSADKSRWKGRSAGGFESWDKETKKQFMEHFGAGHLRAADALAFSFPSGGLGADQERPESQIGFLWVVDLLRSMGLSNDSLLNPLLATMMGLEVSQIVFSENGFTNAARIIETCIVTNRPGADGSSGCAADIGRFLNQLQSHPNISHRLREALDRLSSDSGFLNKPISEPVRNAIRDALEQSNRNTCRLPRTSSTRNE